MLIRAHTRYASRENTRVKTSSRSESEKGPRVVADQAERIR